MPTGLSGASVARNAAVRPPPPSLKMITPAAPASSALCTFVQLLQVPLRWTSAMRPATKPLKLAAVQPLVLVAVAGAGIRMPAVGCTMASTLPLPEYVGGFHCVRNAYAVG